MTVATATTVAPVKSAALDRVRHAVSLESEPARRAEALIVALAEAVKSTSNDQNVQRLSRELRAAAADLALSLAPERV